MPPVRRTERSTSPSGSTIATTPKIWTNSQATRTDDHSSRRQSLLETALLNEAAKGRSSFGSSVDGRTGMDDITRQKLLKIALMTCGAIFFTIYPLSLIWPSGWQWHGGHGQYYFQMICGIYAVLGAFLI